MTKKNAREKQAIFENRRWDVVEVQSLEDIAYDENVAYLIEIEGDEYIIPSYDKRFEDINKPCVYIDGGSNTLNFDLDDPAINTRLKKNVKMFFDTAENIEKIVNRDLTEPDYDVKEMPADETADYFEDDPDDNQFYKIIKKAVNKKKINLRTQYSHKWENNSKFNNHMKAIRDYHNCSLDKFESWCEKLDLEAEVVVRDKPNAPNPMGEELIFKINNN